MISSDKRILVLPLFPCIPHPAGQGQRKFRIREHLPVLFICCMKRSSQIVKNLWRGSEKQHI